MSGLETVIGLEIHAQMNTRSKMFCPCDNDAFGKSPNTTVCPVCMGHPGTLPVPNGEAVRKALRAASALRCEVAVHCHLNRKNYFYPDLPMGYQISQYDFPLAKGGWLEFQSHGNQKSEIKNKKCHIIRLHIENDAGKLMHFTGRSSCDFNRAGTPLMEIVTEPDIRSPADAVALTRELQLILRTVDVSEADMEKGMMRFDASVSIRSMGEETLYARSEIKNLNSFRALERALTFEESRLRKLWEEGAPQEREVTVHWDDEHGIGVILREKESAADYRYFPEPDIPPLCFDETALEEARAAIGALPQERREKYLKTGLSEAQAEMLVGDPRLAEYFDRIAGIPAPPGVPAPLRAASIILTQLIGFLNAEEKTLQEGPSADAIVELLQLVDKGTISANAGKDVLGEMVQTGKTAEEIIGERGLKQIADASELQCLVREALEANPGAVADIQRGKERAKDAIIGFVMGKTKGRANPEIVRGILDRLV